MGYVHSKTFTRLIQFAAVASVTATCILAQAQTDVNPASATPGMQPQADAMPANGLTVAIGRSTLIHTPWPVSQVVVNEPKVADVQILTPRQVLLLGKAVGTTDVIMWGKEEEVWKATVDVQIDRNALKADLVRLFPHAKLDLRPSQDAIVVTGQLYRAEEAEQLHRFLDALKLKYVDLTVLPGIAQVQLKVTIAEANRTAVRALGFNAIVSGNSAFGGVSIAPDNSTTSSILGVGQSGSIGSVTNPVAAAPAQATTIFGGVPSADLAIFVQALAENQYLRVMAEPTLVALSGQEASFLAGGEFPIPVPQSGGGSGINNSTTITVDYKEFGVSLHFRPTVQGDGLIRLHVAPEVSEINNGPGSIQVSGFNIPIITTRRAETTLELHSGQTFAMAGLINQSVAARNSRVPGLGDVPIIGPLFRSIRYQSGDTELLVLVTASLVEPISTTKAIPVPGVTHVAPNDWEFYSLGAIEGHASANPRPRDDGSTAADGLNRLKGPGAWASYDSPPAASGATAESR